MAASRLESLYVVMAATALAGFVWGWSTAHAQERIPPAACTASAPASGQVFSGPVLQVIDGQTLCVADGPTPDHWVRVRLTDVDRTIPRGALMAAAFAKDVICTVERRDGQGVAGRCVFDGASLGELVQSDEIRTQATSWR
jgi:hypothetical protein